ncbi:MAG: hypothetical protein PHO15_07150 [Eubacteriales bacterium]|nr:hypothetical protein [Eubacteriales bacterium]
MEREFLLNSEKGNCTLTPYRIVFAESAMYSDGSTFTDYGIHRALRKRGFKNPDGEWSACSVKDVKAAYIAVINRTQNMENRNQKKFLFPDTIQNGFFGDSKYLTC